MKKLFFSIILFSVFFSAPASAQSNFGVRLGANYSNFYGEEANFDNKVGITGGIYWKKNLNTSPNVAIQFGLDYSQQGAKNDSADLNFNYLVFPAVFKFTRSNLSFEAGFSASALAGANEVVGDSKTDLKTKVSPLDLSAVIGFGIYLNPNLELNLRYQTGLINTPNKGAINGPIAFTFIRDGLKNRYASATLGYFFRSKKEKYTE